MITEAGKSKSAVRAHMPEAQESHGADKTEGSLPRELPLLWEADLFGLFRPSTDYTRPTYIMEGQSPHSKFTNSNVNLNQKHAFKLAQKLNHHRYIYRSISISTLIYVSLYRYYRYIFCSPSFSLTFIEQTWIQITALKLSVTYGIWLNHHKGQSPHLYNKDITHIP